MRGTLPRAYLRAGSGGFFGRDATRLRNPSRYSRPPGPQVPGGGAVQDRASARGRPQSVLPPRLRSREAQFLLGQRHRRRHLVRRDQRGSPRALVAVATLHLLQRARSGGHRGEKRPRIPQGRIQERREKRRLPRKTVALSRGAIRGDTAGSLLPGRAFASGHSLSPSSTRASALRSLSRRRLSVHDGDLGLRKLQEEGGRPKRDRADAAPAGKTPRRARFVGRRLRPAAAPVPRQEFLGSPMGPRGLLPDALRLSSESQSGLGLLDGTPHLDPAAAPVGQATQEIGLRGPEPRPRPPGVYGLAW